ncbi:coiled-coil domain-containing protein 96-like [Synchiropus splendidus]|uniref:coiled-coil domain-containing protein 96-like n=1 Tax=Synchiropus splendidus TaxID=270530 RepID=UPI00237DB253|nr:coiled-coil domain-containing protein 96-like [Synchiropus splendidus]
MNMDAAAPASEGVENPVSNLDPKSENEKDAAGPSGGQDQVESSEPTTVEAGATSLEETHRTNGSQSDDESVEFDVNGEDGGTALQHQLEMPIAEEKELARSPAGDDDLTDDQLLRDLTEEESKAREQNTVLQSRLVKVLQETTVDAQQDEEVLKWIHAKHLKLLAEMKQQEAAELEKIEQLCFSDSVLQERLDEVKQEWHSLFAHQQEVAVKVLSRRQSKDASQAQVASAVKVLQDLEEKVIQKSCDNIRLKMVNDVLEAKFRDEVTQLSSATKTLVEKLNRLQTAKLADHQREKWSELEKKYNVSVQVLSNVKEKIRWAHEKMQANESRLVQLEATLAHEISLMSQTRQGCYHLNGEKAKLKECFVLHGNKLVQDYNNTLEDCRQLEDSLEKIKTRWAELNNSH